MRRLWPIVVCSCFGLAACGGDDGGDSPDSNTTPNGSANADAGPTPDAGDTVDMATNNNSNVVGWSSGEVSGGAIVRIESGSGRVWALGAGAVYAFDGTQSETFDIPEVATPVDLSVSGDDVAVVGVDDSGAPWLVERSGNDWNATELPGDPGAVDIGADAVVRVAVQGGFLERQGENFVPNNFNGAEQLSFNTIEFVESGAAWMFGDSSSLYRTSAGSWSPLLESATTAGDSANATVAFWANGGALTRLDRDDVIPRRESTTNTFLAVEAVSADVGIFAGEAGKLLVATVPEGNGLDELQSLTVAEIAVDAADATFTAVHAVSEDELWLGTEDGRIFRYGLGVPEGWSTVEGDPVSFDVTDPNPDPDPDPDPEPMEQPLVRFVGFGLGTFVCDGSTAFTPELGEYDRVVSGYRERDPRTYELDRDVGAAGGCRGLGLNEFDLDLSFNDIKTVVITSTSSFRPPILDDDHTAPAAGSARVRFYGRDRVGTGDLTDVEYCVDGAPLQGGSQPSTGYVDYAVGELEVEVRISDGSCTGELRDTFSLTLAEGETRSVFLGPGTELGPVRDLDDVFVIDCLDALNGESQVPSTCNSFYAQPPGG